MRILIAAAHADDETLGCFSVLQERAAEVSILHATDSAPRDLKYAWRSGYATRGAYLEARQKELRNLLAKAGIPAERYHCLGLADQEAPVYWPQIRAWVESFEADRVYTHAYEGGHPDHDAVALALSGLPNVWEFPLYHGRRAEFVTHSFLDGEAEIAIELDDDRRAVKHSWLDCYPSQKRVIDMFPLERELFRPARAYDFTRPPHEGELYYERRKLGWTWREWREAVSKALH
ncbi:MAG: PIG-L family deacetylase [Acidobacteria bacterium]|nr:PIG-L family deacetylase [Acidobacteriota bacterium]